MGGNIFPNSQRLNNYEFNANFWLLENDIVKAEEAAGNYCMSIYSCTKSYLEKDSHGDIDVICTFFEQEEDIVNFLVNHVDGVSRDAIQYGKGNISFLYHGKYQVDLIHCESPSFAHQYYSYNDFGALLGVLCRNLGYKLRNDGVYYEVYSPVNLTQKLGEILVTYNWEDVLDLVGLPTSTRLVVFKNLEEIFKKVASAESFRWELFLPENFSSKQRARAGKRTTFIEFQKWIETHKGILNSVEEMPLLPKPLSEVDTSSWVAYKEMVRKHLEELEFKKKFNGELVQEATGLTGPDLGSYMDYLKTKSWFSDFVRDQDVTCDIIKYCIKGMTE